MKNIPNYMVAIIVALIGWGSWVSIGVAQIDSLVTKSELLETKIILIESQNAITKASEETILKAIEGIKEDMKDE